MASYSSGGMLVRGAVNFASILPFDARQPIRFCIASRMADGAFIREILALSRFIHQTPFMTRDESSMAKRCTSAVSLCVISANQRIQFCSTVPRFSPFCLYVQDLRIVLRKIYYVNQHRSTKLLNSLDY